MKNEKKFKELSRRNKICTVLGLVSFYAGEQKCVKCKPALSAANTIFGLATNGYSLINAFRMMDEFDGAKKDEKVMVKHLTKEFILNPIANSLLLAYSSASDESKKKILSKLSNILRG